MKFCQVLKLFNLWETADLVGVQVYCPNIGKETSKVAAEFGDVVERQVQP